MTPLFIVPLERNRLTSALEVAEFCDDPPDRYTAYISEAAPSRVATWMGDALGEVISWGKGWRSNMGDRRRSFRMRAVNGHVYSGVTTSAHELVHLRRLK